MAPLILKARDDVVSTVEQIIRTRKESVNEDGLRSSDSNSSVASDMADTIAEFNAAEYLFLSYKVKHF